MVDEIVPAPSTPYVTAELILQNNHILTDMASNKVFIYKNGYYTPKNSIPFIKQEAQRILGPAVTTSKVNEVKDYIIRTTYTEVKSNPNYLCLNNCLLNLNTMQTEPFTPEKIVTFKIPVTYRPEVNSKPFNNYVKELVDEKDVIVLQQAIGNIFAPHYLTKKLVYLYGDKDSGKTTFMFIIQSFLGEDNYTNLSLNQLGETFTNTDLCFKLANITAEEKYNIPIRSYGDIKIFTSGDGYMFQDKGEKPFKYSSIAKQFFSGNGIPAINHRDVDDAFFRRWQFVKFPKHFEPDETIVSLYTTDVMKSSILNWAIEGYLSLKANNWTFKNETSIDEAKVLFEGAIYEKSLLDQFLEECCKASEEVIVRKTLWRRYGDWCRSKKRFDMVNFGPFVKDMMKQKVIHVIKCEPIINEKQEDCFKGISLKEVYD